VASADEALGDPLSFEGDDWWAAAGVMRKVRGKEEGSIGGGDVDLEKEEAWRCVAWDVDVQVRGEARLMESEDEASWWRWRMHTRHVL
jgi:hypothetical protein